MNLDVVTSSYKVTGYINRFRERKGKGMEEKCMKRMQNQTMPVKKQTWRDKATYVKKNWQLYLFFLMPGLLLTITF